MPQITDPAFELYRLCKSLSVLNHKGSSADALAALLNVEPASSDYYSAMGLIANRFSRLSELYDRTLENPVLCTAKNNLAVIQSFMRGDRQQATWPSVRNEVFGEAPMNVLLMSSGIVRSRAPLFVPTKEEQEKSINDIKSAMMALEEFDGPVTGALYDALRGTLRLIERLDIYGVDALMDQIIKAFAIHSVVQQEHEVPAKERDARASAWTTIAFLSGLLVAPDAVFSAIENHYARAQTIIRMVAERPRMIEGPKTASEDGETNKSTLAITSDGTESQNTGSASRLPQND